MTLPDLMAAALRTGHGGRDQDDYRPDVTCPRPEAGEVLIEVAAAAVNNTDINTRIGWSSKAVSSGTNDGGTNGFSAITAADAAWSGEAMAFPRIQGADVCGRIAAVGEGVSE